MAESHAMLEAQLRQAAGLHQAKRLAEAENLYRQVLGLRPDLAEVHVNCALAQLGQGKFGEAEKSLRQAIAAQPELAKAHSHLGNALCFQKRYGEAIGCYQSAIALKPDYPEAYNNLGNVFTVLGEMER